MWKVAAVTIASGVLIYSLWPKGQTIRTEPGDRIAPNTPIQQAVAAPQTWQIDNYTIQALAEFSLEARVLGRKLYRSDREADLSPVDLALGWGPMSDQYVLDQIEISQRNRWYYWRASTLPIPHNEIVRNSANMHMIPANEAVELQLRTVRPGRVIQLEGYLVAARAPDGWQWRSSLTRNDSGARACELIYVERVTLL